MPAAPCLGDPAVDRGGRDAARLGHVGRGPAAEQCQLGVHLRDPPVEGVRLPPSRDVQRRDDVDDLMGLPARLGLGGLQLHARPRHVLEVRADLPRERVDLRLDAAQGQRPQRGRVDPLFAGQLQLTDDQPPVAVLPDPDMHPFRDGVVGEGDPAALADGELAQRPRRDLDLLVLSHGQP